MDERPIAFFDSGVGGFTVLRAALQILPNQKYLYFADSARMPYGDLSPEAIFQSTLESLQFLVEKNVKAIVVACHTASVTCLPVLQKEISIPLLGVAEGTIQSLSCLPSSSRVAILGTTRTIQSGFYQEELTALGFQVFPVACPSLAPLIEQGIFEGSLLEEKIRLDLGVVVGEKIDAVLFVCTHYPLIQSAFKKVLGSDLIYLDASYYTALQLSKMISSKGESSLDLYKTGSSDLFLQVAERILQKPLQCHAVITNIVNNV